MSQNEKYIPEYEQLLDSLAYDPKVEKLLTFIEIAAASNYYSGRIELLFLQHFKHAMLNDYLSKYFDVPKEFTNQQINGKRENFKLQLILIMIFYNVKFPELSQNMIDNIKELMPYVNLNFLQNSLNKANYNRFYEGQSSKIIGVENISTKMMTIVDRYINHLTQNGQYSESSSFKSFLKRFLVFISQKPFIKNISDIKRVDIEEYIEYLATAKYNELIINKYRNSFVYRHLRALYHFFEYLNDIQDSLSPMNIPQLGLFDKSDFPQPNRRSVKHLPLWADKLIIKRIRMMAEGTDAELIDKTIMLLLYYTGVRGSDACTVEKDCLFEKKNTNWIRIFSNKTKKEYEIPINDELHTYLKKCIENKRKSVSNIHPTTGKKTKFLFWGNCKYSTFRRNIDYLVKKLSDMAKYDALKQGISIEDINSINITSHKFRHTVAIRLCRMGADPLLIAEMLGHKDLYMAQAYIQEDENYINEVMDEVLEEEFLNIEGESVMLPNYFDTVALSLFESKDDIFKSKCRIKRYDGGWCVYEGETQPCGSNGDCDCFLCPSLKPDYDDPDYYTRLEKLLNEHQELFNYNKACNFLGDAKKEDMIISKIRMFLEDIKKYETTKKK